MKYTENYEKYIMKQGNFVLWRSNKKQKSTFNMMS